LIETNTQLMKFIICFLTLFIGLESMTQTNRADTLYFNKTNASLNSSALFSLSCLDLEEAGQLLIINAKNECDSPSILFNNCLFYRRAQTLKSFLMTQGVDSNRIVIYPSKVSNPSDKRINHELLLSETESQESQLEYSQIAYAINPKSWQKKNRP
jgi:hypothetical protein